MSFTCPHCGAVLPAGESCQDRFNLSQIKEMEQPAYYIVHHLSVACYLLQHNDELTPAMARQRYGEKFDSGHRTWSVTRGAKLPGVENIAWTRTIADVRLDTAEGYCADVRRWAESVLADSEPLIRECP